MFCRDVYSLWKTLADAENRFTPDSGVREPNGELLWIQPDRQAHDRDRDVVGLLLWGGVRGGADRESHPATFTVIASAH